MMDSLMLILNLPMRPFGSKTVALPLHGIVGYNPGYLKEIMTDLLA